jgi:hypothetical protein
VLHCASTVILCVPNFLISSCAANTWGNIDDYGIVTNEG